MLPRPTKMLDELVTEDLPSNALFPHEPVIGFFEGFREADARAYFLRFAEWRDLWRGFWMSAKVGKSVGENYLPEP